MNAPSIKDFRPSTLPNIIKRYYYSLFNDVDIYLDEPLDHIGLIDPILIDSVWSPWLPRIESGYLQERLRNAEIADQEKTNRHNEEEKEVDQVMNLVLGVPLEFKRPWPDHLHPKNMPEFFRPLRRRFVEEFLNTYSETTAHFRKEYKGFDMYDDNHANLTHTIFRNVWEPQRGWIDTALYITWDEQRTFIQRHLYNEYVAIWTLSWAYICSTPLDFIDHFYSHLGVPNPRKRLGADPVDAVVDEDMISKVRILLALGVIQNLKKDHPLFATSDTALAKELSRVIDGSAGGIRKVLNDSRWGRRDNKNSPYCDRDDWKKLNERLEDKGITISKQPD